jgi:hypothetical protein
LDVELTTQPCKKIVEKPLKFSRILWRRPRPKLGCGAKEKRRMGRKLRSGFFWLRIGTRGGLF